MSARQAQTARRRRFHALDKVNGQERKKPCRASRSHLNGALSTGSIKSQRIILVSQREQEVLKPPHDLACGRPAGRVAEERWIAG